MTQVVYRVSIDLPVGLTAPRDGGLDNRNSRQHYPLSGWPSTIDASTAKVRGNIRWRQMILDLGRAAVCRMSDITPVGGSSDTSPTSIAFTLIYDRDDYVREGSLTGGPAIVRQIATSLTRTVAMVTTVVDATTPDAINDILTTVVAGPLFTDIATAEWAITVTLLATI